MIDPFYLELYPVLTQDWTDTGLGFGNMKFVTDITTQNDDLHARLFIHVGNNWASVNLQVKHRIHGSSFVSLGDAKQPADSVWALVGSALPTLEEQVLTMYDSWAKEIEQKWR